MRVDVAVGGARLTADADALPEEVAGGAVLRGDRVRLSSPVPVTRFYRHGWHSWSPTRWLDTARPVAEVTVPELRATADDPVHAGSRRHGGSGVGAVDCGDGRVLLLGALGAGAWVEALHDALDATSEVRGVDWFVAHGVEEAVFARYAELLGERLGRRTRAAPRVWSSWYSLYAGITESVLRDVVDDLGGLPVDVVQVDDGWQRAMGDWDANDDFPSGMAALAASIRAAGFSAGLWLAPFVAGEGSRLAREHPEYLVTAADGRPAKAGHNWGGDYYGIDVTHPGARGFVRDLVRTAVDWGFGYLKLDFLFAGALPGGRHDDVPREVAYRDGLALVREAVGDDTYVLACGAPVIASVGLVDALRVGPDVAPWWELEYVTRYLHDLSGASTRYAIATSLHRLWLQPVVAVDPDVVYTSARGNCLTAAQRDLLADLARIAGFKATSDLPAVLSVDERAALAELLSSPAEVRRLDRYRFAVDGRVVDFTSVAAAEPHFR